MNKADPWRINSLASFAVLAGVLCGAQSAAASCQYGSQPMGPAVVAGYLASPASLLTEYPLGQDGLRNAVAQFVSSTPGGVTAVMSIVAQASNAQRRAIGQGLGAAVNTCSIQDSSVVQRINNAIKSSGSGGLTQSFYMSLDDSTSSPASTDAPLPTAGASGGPLLPDDVSKMTPSGADKLPDPFGSPDAWH